MIMMRHKSSLFARFWGPLFDLCNVCSRGMLQDGLLMTLVAKRCMNLEVDNMMKLFDCVNISTFLKFELPVS